MEPPWEAIRGDSDDQGHPGQALRGPEEESRRTPAQHQQRGHRVSRAFLAEPADRARGISGARGSPAGKAGPARPHGGISAGGEISRQAMIVVDTNVVAYLLLGGEKTPQARAAFRKDPD